MTRMWTRRDFLKAGGGALAAAALTAADAPPKKPFLHKAIMYATIGYKGPVLEQFKMVRAAGAKEAQARISGIGSERVRGEKPER